MLVILLLVIVVGIITWFWKPWQANIKASDRTISVTGSSTIKTEPDEFVFYPTYDVTNADPKTALAQMTAKSDEIVTKLKSLGVASSKIKTDSNGYNSTSYYPINEGGGSTYSLYLTVTVDDKALAQKVQDYLVTTAPTGSVTPMASLSTAKQKTVEAQARDKAEQDARTKADQSAKNLGFKVKAVKSVEDGSLQSIGCPGGLCYGSNINADLQSAAAKTSSQLTLQPGENELPYSVKVIYYIN